MSEEVRSPTSTSACSLSTTRTGRSRMNGNAKTMSENHRAACRRSAERCRRRAEAAEDEISKVAWLTFAEWRPDHLDARRLQTLRIFS
jgi:hypothetical protein